MDGFSFILLKESLRRILQEFLLLLIVNMYNLSFGGECIQFLCNLLNSHNFFISSFFFFPLREVGTMINCVMGDRESFFGP